MKRKLPLFIVPLAALLAILLIPQGESQVVETPAVTVVSQPSGAAGMRLYVDPETGEFVERPTVPSTIELAEDGVGPYSTSDEGLYEVEAAGGGVMVDLQGRFRQAYVATVDESGNVKASCGHVHPDGEAATGRRAIDHEMH